MSTETIGKKSTESLSHFQCGLCHKWWSIGDAPDSKEEWHCPWCGQEQIIKLSNEQKSKPSL